MFIDDFLKRPVIQILILIILILWSAGLAGFLISDGNNKLSEVSERDKLNKTNETGVARKIDGVIVPKEKANLYPIAIMIENMVDSRPPSGLSKANLVYEVVAEAGITRFLAFYASDEEIKEIGPIRSARPYFLDWAEEFKALYLHVGGSSQALGKIPQRKIIDLDQYFNGKYFWRDKSRLAPHNVYTSSELLAKVLEDKKIPLEGDFDSLMYKLPIDNPESLDAGFEAKKIIINFSTPSYQVEWQYKPQTNDYFRFQAGQSHQDLDGLRIRAKNIVVQVAETQILDEIGRRKIKTWGEGKAFIFQDGRVIKGKWMKNRSNGLDKIPRTKFYSELGQEIEFNQGTTWIEVIPNENSVAHL